MPTSYTPDPERQAIVSPSSPSGCPPLTHPTPFSSSTLVLLSPLLISLSTPGASACSYGLLLNDGLLWALAGLPMHARPAHRLPVCLCALLFPGGLQRPGVCPGALHRAWVWLFSTSWCLHQPQSSRCASSSAAELERWTSSFRTTAERLPDPVPHAGWERKQCVFVGGVFPTDQIMHVHLHRWL